MATNEELRDSIAAILAEEIGKLPVELILSTGETLSHEAMELARLYDRVGPKQQAAFEALRELCSD